jgi:hypothetical protein
VLSVESEPASARSASHEPAAAAIPEARSADQPGIAAALDLHEGIGTPRGCRRCSAALQLRSSEGQLVPIRCHAPNLCEYCARRAAVETSELLLLDAMEHAPTLYVVLTARELLEKADCKLHLKKLLCSLRRRWPSLQWAVIVEFQRRGALHLNLLVKGVPVDELDELRDRVVARWCARVDAEPAAQFAGEISNGPGLVRYIALHFLKPAQAPPIGWRGHRVSYTRGYLVRPASAMREEARRSLALKREVWRARQRGLDAHEAELVAHEAVAIADATSWELVHVTPVGERQERDAVKLAAGAALRDLEEAAATEAAGRELHARRWSGIRDELAKWRLERGGLPPALDPSRVRGPTLSLQ